MLDFYPIIFRSGDWLAYKEAIFRIQAIFYQYQHRHYNKLPLAFLSDIFYWTSTDHPISQAFRDSLHVFNDYYVKNFYSSLRRQIQKSHTVEQIIQHARIIDYMRSGNSFTDMFFENHNIRYSAKQLEYLEKQTTLFLLNFFTSIYKNLGRSTIISSDVHSKSKLYEFLTLEAQVDVKILLMAQNTEYPLQNDRYCNFEGCIDSCKVGCILICGHAYHFECFLFKLQSQCWYCTNYLVSGIESNCKAFQKTLNSFGGMVTDENTKKLDNIGTEDNTNIGDEDFSLDNNINQLFKNAVNILTSV